MREAGSFASAADALAAVSAGLSHLTGLDPTLLTPAEQADCLRALGRAESQTVAARSALLATFDRSRGFEDDAAGGTRSWLRWQTQVTSAAAAGAMAWMRRLAAHPVVARALAAGRVSPSWARHLCDWTDRLPEDSRADADEILLAAAGSGAALSDLAGLAEEMYRRCARPDFDDDDDGFKSRSVRLTSYFRGEGQLEGNLTPDCTAAVRAVLDALGAKAGREDLRTQEERDHDALAEAMRRLIASGCLPDRAGQPTVIQLHMSLEQLLGLPGSDQAIAEWAGYGAAAGPGHDCDAKLVPVVSGHVDPAVLDQLAAELLPPDPGQPEPGQPEPGQPESGQPGPGQAESGPGQPESGQPASQQPVPVPPVSLQAAASAATASARTATIARTAARELAISRATRLLSGPAGLAAWLRTSLTAGPAATISQPLDIGAPTEIIPPHLRRAIVLRDRHCSFPGCQQPPAGCQVHHLIKRSEGGPTSLDNLVLLCAFHHLCAIHRWGWQLRLNPDGTTTATSPDGRRTLHSHGPPGQVA